MNFAIKLTNQAKAELKKRTRGQYPASVCQRALALLLSGAGKTVAEIEASTGYSSASIKRVKARFRKEGWQAAITAKKAPGNPPISEKKAKLVIATFCSPVPEGRHRWTIRMVSERTGVGPTTVHKIIKADGLKPWREKNVVHSHDQRRIPPAPVFNH